MGWSLYVWSVAGIGPTVQVHAVRLADDDIAGSRAHARALGRAGLLTADELQRMEDALDTLQRHVDDGSFAPIEDDEDEATALERGLIDIAGDELGGKLRAGRSRNDQIACLIRMWLRPASAPEPYGEALMRLSQSISRCTSRISGQAWAMSWCASSTGWACCMWVRPGITVRPAPAWTSPACPRRSSSGTPRSSPSSSSTTAIPPAPPSCRRRRTRISPSSPAASPADSSAI